MRRASFTGVLGVLALVGGTACGALLEEAHQKDVRENVRNIMDYQNDDASSNLKVHCPSGSVLQLHCLAGQKTCLPQCVKANGK